LLYGYVKPLCDRKQHIFKLKKELGLEVDIPTSEANSMPSIHQLPNLSLPSPSLPSPSLPGPSLPNPSLPGPSLPGPSLPNPSLPNPSLLNPSLPVSELEIPSFILELEDSLQGSIDPPLSYLLHVTQKVPIDKTIFRVKVKKIQF
jgi:hypothetical protein